MDDPYDLDIEGVRLADLPYFYRSALTELKQDLDEGDITQKGFQKKRRQILLTYLRGQQYAEQSVRSDLSPTSLTRPADHGSFALSSSTAPAPSELSPAAPLVTYSPALSATTHTGPYASYSSRPLSSHNSSPSTTTSPNLAGLDFDILLNHISDIPSRSSSLLRTASTNRARPPPPARAASSAQPPAQMSDLYSPIDIYAGTRKSPQGLSPPGLLEDSAISGADSQASGSTPASQPSETRPYPRASSPAFPQSHSSPRKAPPPSDPPPQAPLSNPLNVHHLSPPAKGLSDDQDWDDTPILPTPPPRPSRLSSSPSPLGITPPRPPRSRQRSVNTENLQRAVHVSDPGPVSPTAFSSRKPSDPPKPFPRLPDEADPDGFVDRGRREGSRLARRPSITYSYNLDDMNQQIEDLILDPTVPAWSEASSISSPRDSGSPPPIMTLSSPPSEKSNYATPQLDPASLLPRGSRAASLTSETGDSRPPSSPSRARQVASASGLRVITNLSSQDLSTPPVARPVQPQPQPQTQSQPPRQPPPLTMPVPSTGDIDSLVYHLPGTAPRQLRIANLPDASDSSSDSDTGPTTPVRKQNPGVGVRSSPSRPPRFVPPQHLTTSEIHIQRKLTPRNVVNGSVSDSDSDSDDYNAGSRMAPRRPTNPFEPGPPMSIALKGNQSGMLAKVSNGPGPTNPLATGAASASTATSLTTTAQDTAVTNPTINYFNLRAPASPSRSQEAAVDSVTQPADPAQSQPLGADSLPKTDWIADKVQDELLRALRPPKPPTFQVQSHSVARNIPAGAYSPGLKFLMDNFTSLPGLLKYRAIQTPKTLAYMGIDNKGKEGMSITWQRLYQRTERIVKLLRNKGVVCKGDRVALVYRKSEVIDFLVAFYGVMSAGMCAVPM
ncbi:hypothetical protein BJ085DRAFT_27225, partial [Dimargaris cristalligena]